MRILGACLRAFRLAPATIQTTFKSLKPPFSTIIPVSPADPTSAIKTQIAAQPRAPPADAQRLPAEGQGAGGRQAPEGVQRPGWRHDQPHAQARHRMESHQVPGTLFVVILRTAAFCDASGGDGVA